ncbi:MAG TPA: hypothetical protein DHV46_03625 [Desulfovibrio piger]|nr:hypothetical protein [Desulfovibrio piger]
MVFFLSASLRGQLPLRSGRPLRPQRPLPRFRDRCGALPRASPAACARTGGTPRDRKPSGSTGPGAPGPADTGPDKRSGPGPAGPPGPPAGPSPIWPVAGCSRSAGLSIGGRPPPERLAMPLPCRKDAPCPTPYRALRRFQT